MALWQRNKWILVVCTVVLSASFLAGCGKRAQRGAVIGGAAGAVAGAVVGHQTGHKTEGAIIGGAAGAVIGGVIGNRLDKQAEELAQIAETRRTEQGVIVNLSSNTVHFEVNSSQVNPESRDILAQLGQVLKNYPEDLILVAGHTDSDGTADYNAQLSQMRAQAVADIIMSQGVPANVITVRGYGETQPVAENDTAGNKALNRRVELSITVDESKVPQEE
jgi:outer membrane protein OmpA-like peptidoglycan-associated protein